MRTHDAVLGARPTAPNAATPTASAGGEENDSILSTDRLTEPETSSLIATRKGKRDALRAAGVDPYPYVFAKTHSVEELTQEPFARLEQAGVEVAVPGRVMAIRSHGGLVFMDLGIVRHGPKLQLAVVGSQLDTSSRAVFDGVDLGDWIGAIGHLMYTRTGQETMKVDRLVMLAKALRPLPNFKGSSVADPELLAQMPELAMIFGEKRQVLRQRATIIRTLRRVLEERGLTEVETPYLNPYFGGAEARPFTTHVNALDRDVFLPVSPEIELKRLIVGGLEGVFAIARNFRNEGLDQRHNPEFTGLEVYVPYTDYEAMMDLVEEIFFVCCTAVHEEPRCRYGNIQLDFTPPWPRVPVVEAVETAMGIVVSQIDAATLRTVCRMRRLHEGCSPEGMLRSELLMKLSCTGVPSLQGNWDGVTDEELRAAITRHRLHVPLDLEREWDFLVLDLFQAFVEPTLVQPCHVTLHPARSTVLCKRYRGKPLPNSHELVERFESYAVGMELCNAYSELNDPEVQRRLIEEQAEARAAGRDEAMPHNELFVRSLEYGMPPCGGLGIGVDRLVMLLTGAIAIREVIAFPLVKV